MDVTSVSEHTMCEITSVGFMIDSLVVGFEVREFVTQVFELLTHSLCPCFALALEAHELYVTKTDVVVEYVTSGHDALLEIIDWTGNETTQEPRPCGVLGDWGLSPRLRLLKRN
jgi:hypothetical protein